MEVKCQNYSHVTNGREYKTKTRIISSNTCVNGVSSNWRFDSDRFKGHTFAQVLKNTPKHLYPETKNSHQVAISSHHSVCNIAAPSKIMKVVCHSEPKPEAKKCTKFNTRGRVSNSTKASQVATCNRYESLQEGDGIILRQPDIDVTYSECDPDLIGVDNRVNNPVKSDISDCLNY